MTALVAGGAGFVGSNLCEQLLDDGEHVVCVDNFVTGRMANIAHLLDHPAFVFIEHDLVVGLPEMPAVGQIYHLASPASPPGYQDHAVATMRVNSEGTRHMLELAKSCGARFLYASTSEVYGDPLQHPQREEHRGNVSCIGPRSMYDEAKRYGEAVTMVFVRTGVRGRVVRIFNTYGPRSDPLDGRLVPNFITQALRGEPLTIYGDGHQTRSLCYVSDLVDGLIRTMNCDAATGIPVNLGNPEEHTVLEFAEVIRELVGSRSPLIFTDPAVGDDPQRRCPDISRAQTLLDWSPRLGLREGLAATIAYFRDELAQASEPASRAPMQEPAYAARGGD